MMDSAGLGTRFKNYLGGIARANGIPAVTVESQTSVTSEEWLQQSLRDFIWVPGIAGSFAAFYAGLYWPPLQGFCWIK